jgi:hypothetical protein
MIGIEDTDLASALARVGQRMSRHAADIILEITNPSGADAVASQLEEIARQVRLHGSRVDQPTVIEG